MALETFPNCWFCGQHFFGRCQTKEQADKCRWRIRDKPEEPREFFRLGEFRERVKWWSWS